MILISRKASAQLKREPKISEVISFSNKCSFYQFIYITIQIISLLTLALFITTFYYSEIPEFEVPLVTLYYDPASRLDLNNLPIITYSVNVVAKVRKKNVIPVPISVEAKAALWSNIPEEYYVSTTINNIILWPYRTTYISARVTINFPLFQQNLRLLSKILNTCGLINPTSVERTLLNVDVFAKVYFGYGWFSFPIRTVIRRGLTAYCPVVEENLAQILLAYASKLVPYDEFYDFEGNDELDGDYNTYLGYK
ncbi:hypothetical protein CONCODRAFT_14205 [Conidiobolus coronatus NRRL 28638]|uniref:Late embryogenesis abundant protein LEA-2 subgroup domain-containing protein n=1 Tax=Conidiobolus coronatus (strain ATCC 28846 / CBS 209.66 / NRRL 28638) TaxID=796925 RepID=A0A137NPF7_CONC2|nr:hypothetical protein CONCODRAFT_14205 [Conidiobolus coronatus NRRL 28638]|eukprot:KXN64623.1 hypothetical protein CONCODRAFT_14205 [Conidiobolus coronatus NRRL 28638]